MASKSFATYRSPYPDGLPGHSDTDTSVGAAANIRGRANKLQERVYGFICSRGSSGATASEIAEELDIWRDTVGPRITELRAMAMVVDSGLRRPSPRRRPEIVWVAINTEPQMEMFR